MYILISITEDGTYTQQFENNSSLTKYLEKYHSDYPVKFLNKLPEDFSHIESLGLFIFKGEVVIPKPATIVKTFEVE